MKKNNLKLYLLVMACLVILTGCITRKSTPLTKYYLLEDEPSNIQWEENNQRLELHLIQIPSYLKQSKLVMLEDSNLMYFANYHQWAVELEPSLKSILLNDLNAKSVTQNFYASCSDCQKLEIEISSFYPRFDGKIHLSANITSYLDGKERIQSVSLNVDQTQDGYIGAVRAMRKALKELADDIVANL